MKKRVFIIGALLVASIVAVNVRKIRTQAINEQDFAVACLPSGYDLHGADVALKNDYDIAHTPREGGRCYFKLPAGSLRCMNPRQAESLAERGLFDLGPSYSSHSGNTCYFLNPSQYETLLETVRRRPPASRNEYKGKVVNTWREVARILRENASQK